MKPKIKIILASEVLRMYKLKEENQLEKKENSA